MTKKKRLEDIYYPVPRDFGLTRVGKAPENKEVIRRIIQGTVRAAYQLKNPDKWDYHGNPVKPTSVATNEQMGMVMHLIESLHPADAIEAALASQFAITYIRGIEAKSGYGGEYPLNLELFEFGHKVLEALQKYRSKGAQQISVQYNVNQGQVVNIKNVEKSDQPVTIEEVNI